MSSGIPLERVVAVLLDSGADGSQTGSGYLEAYSKDSLKKYRPMAARNDVR